MTIPTELRELMEDLRDLAYEEVERHRQAMGAYRRDRQARMDATIAKADAVLATPPADAADMGGQAGEEVDAKLRAAGMLSVADLLKGAPLDAFIRHAGVCDFDTLLQWAEMRRGECLRMLARYDLGEKDKGDDLYEWIVAHSAVFTELHVNIRAAAESTAQHRQQAGKLVEALRSCTRAKSAAEVGLIVDEALADWEKTSCGK